MKRLLSISIDRQVFAEGSAVRERMRQYAKDWDEIHMIVASDRTYRETAIASNVWIYPTRSRARIFYPFDAMRLGRFIVRGRGITHMTCQDPFLTAMAAVALKKEFPGVPLEIQVHTDIGSPNYAYSLANRMRKAMALSYLRKADTIRVVSNRIREYLVRQLGIAEAKITVRPIPVDAGLIRNLPISADLRGRYPKFRKIAFMASRFTREKNIGLALEAWKKVVSSVPDAGLVIVGSGPEEASLRRLIRTLGLQNSVFIESWADQPTLFSYYKTADLYLLTSLFEGYGMTLVEAQAAGCRMVSTDVGVAREVGAAIVGWSPEDVARGITNALGV